jgi:hypothetical protein
MWPFKKRTDVLKKQLEPVAAWAIVLSVVALAAALGVARWSWLMLDEQISLRKEFVELKNEQVQTNIQYEYWLGKIRAERDEMRKLIERSTSSTDTAPKK